MLKVEELSGKRSDLMTLNKFPCKIYKNDPNWVPMLISDQLNTLRGINHALFENGPHTIFMAYRDGEPVGRILAGVDAKLNDIANIAQGYFALFECVDDQEVANLLFDTAKNWCAQHGTDTMIGPASPTNGEDSKGVLMDDFTSPPKLMNSYNHPYYIKLYENYGFEKDEDHVAYIFSREEALKYLDKRPEIEMVEKRFNFRVDRFNIKQMRKECSDIHRILQEGMPEDWEYTTPASLEAIYDEFNMLSPLYQHNFVHIARSNIGDRPIGFIIGLQDYNVVMKKMNGHMFPLGWLYFLTTRKKIDTVRIFVQFVVKDYWRKGVNSAIFYEMCRDLEASNIKWVEASCIGERNTISRSSVENAGMKLYRTYRVFRTNMEATGPYIKFVEGTKW